MAQRTINDWFSEYSESHQNHTNKLIHWICVPGIFFSVVCLLSLVPITYRISLAEVVMALALVFYIRLSPKLATGLLLFYLACLWGAYRLGALTFPLWQTALIIFVVAWIGQFIGHKIEGKKPSFLKDIQFLLIGPAWLLGFVYKRVGISY